MCEVDSKSLHITGAGTRTQLANIRGSHSETVCTLVLVPNVQLAQALLRNRNEKTITI